jgi:hypothetical protein
VIYPMNALANSQMKELEKFLAPVDGVPAVTFARYTGQESGDERQAIKSNPPDVLLTNFMMLELLMTRQNELDQTVIRNCQDLNFVVLDELHTYRGRQGADVAMLIRRVRERLEGQGVPIQCVGTSATMATEGTREDRDALVADVASRLFGTHVERDCIITETLRRATDETLTVERIRAQLGPAIDTGLRAGLSNVELAKHPLAVWVETRLGLKPSDDGGAWIRAEPRQLMEAAEWLAGEAERPTEACRDALQTFLLEASRPESERMEGGNGRVLRIQAPPVPCRGGSSLHDAGHARLAPRHRGWTNLRPRGSAKTALRAALLPPMWPGFHPVKHFTDAGSEHFIARDIDDTPPADDSAEENDEPREMYGFVMPEPADEFAFQGRDGDYPEAWQEITAKGEIRLKAAYRRNRAVEKLVQPDGRVSAGGSCVWFLPGKFRFCPSCGDYLIGAGRDINRLAGNS